MHVARELAAAAARGITLSKATTGAAVGPPDTARVREGVGVDGDPYRGPWYRLRVKAAASSWLSTWWLKRTLETTREHARGDLLDIGCGTAPYRGFFDVKRHVTMDWPGSYHGSQAVDVFGSAESLPFADKSFDTVLCTEVLEHLPHPEAAIHEIARVLRPFGRLILTVPFLYGMHEVPHDYVRFTEHGLRNLLKEHSMEPVHFLQRGGTVAVMTDLYSKLAHRVARAALRQTPHRIRERVMGAVIVTPQAVVAKVTEFAEKHAPWIPAALNGGRAATLGYVVVATREPSTLPR